MSAQYCADKTIGFLEHFGEHTISPVEWGGLQNPYNFGTSSRRCARLKGSQTVSKTWVFALVKSELYAQNKGMKPYTWLLFDADNTLFDFRQAEALALQATFDDWELEFNSQADETYQRINHQVWRDFEQGRITAEILPVRRFDLLFQALGVDGDAAAFSAGYVKNLSQQAALLDGALELITTLDGRGYHLALLTNGLKEVQRPRLARSALANSFEVVIVSAEVGVAKPAADFFDVAFRAMGNPSKEQTLLIGDSLSSDMQGGLNYGIDTCWYNPTDAPVSLPVRYTIRKLDELFDILDGTEEKNVSKF